jgi:hypothetical protein
MGVCVLFFISKGSSLELITGENTSLGACLSTESPESLSSDMGIIITLHPIILASLEGSAIG